MIAPHSGYQISKQELGAVFVEGSRAWEIGYNRIVQGGQLTLLREDSRLRLSKFCRSKIFVPLV